MSATRPTRIPLGDEPEDVLERATVAPARPRGDGASADPGVYGAYHARVLDAVRLMLRGVPHAEIVERHGHIVANWARDLSGRERLVMLARACGGAR